MFYECNSLTAIPSSFKDFGDGTKITQAYSAFSNCYSLQNGLESWDGLKNCGNGDYMFYNCKSLTKIPSNWTDLGTNLQNTISMNP